ncbi:MAG: DUF2585 family protein [bacterium]|nr:DUF2585 family protein [bacterium]
MTLKLGIFLSIGVILITVIILSVMGRVPFCECGEIGLWGGIYLNPQMSQQLADIYTPSHFLHGIIFFWILYALRKKIPMSIGVMLLIATVVEVGWEIFENTEFIINRYREVTISFDYYGDSIYNTVGDILFMMVGFVFAYKLPGWASIIAFLVLETGVLLLIRDNLTLNILMLVYPMEAIRIWQSGGI